MLKKILVLLMLVGGFNLQAAVKSPTTKNTLSALDKLNLPSSRRFEAFKTKQGLDVLGKIAFSEGYKLAERWRAMAVITRNFPTSKQALKGLKHKKWFLRNSSLLGLAESKNKKAIQWAIKYLDNDPSLIVRSAAVDVLSKNPNKRTKVALRNNINNKLNFRKGQPLWVRKNILQAIYNMSTKDDLPRIMSDLNRKKIDEQHSKYLFEALPRISGHSINTTPFDSEQEAWLNWWQKRKPVSR